MMCFFLRMCLMRRSFPRSFALSTRNVKNCEKFITNIKTKISPNQNRKRNKRKIPFVSYKRRSLLNCFINYLVNSNKNGLPFSLFVSFHFAVFVFVELPFRAQFRFLRVDQLHFTYEWISWRPK